MLDETLLDAPDALARADTHGLLRDVAGAGARVRTALRGANEAGLGELRPEGRPRAVLIAGPGPATSAFADLLGALTGNGPPVSRLRPGGARDTADAARWALPGWAGPLDLLLLATPDGSEPGLTALSEQAYRRGCTVVAVCPPDAPLGTSLGRTRGMVIPLVPDPGPAPTAGRPGAAPEGETDGGEGQTAHGEARAAGAAALAPGRTWALLTPLLVLAGRLGLIHADTPALESLADHLDRVAERCGPAIETYVNPAKTLAAELADSVPLLWSDGPLAGMAARRFATAHTLLAGRPALAAELPEATTLHGALLTGPDAGGADPDDFFRDRVTEPEPRRARVVLLHDGPGDTSTGSALDDASTPDAAGSAPQPEAAPGPGPYDEAATAARALAAARGVPLSTLRPQDARDPLSAAAELVATADFVTIYLALADAPDT